MSEIKFFDAFANKPYRVIVKDENCNYSSCESTRYKEDAIEIATIYLKTYKYVKVVYEPTNQVVWSSKEEQKMKAYRHVYLDFPDFTQESCYEITSKVTFQDGVKDEIKTTIVCDDPYDAMKMVKEFLLSKKDWLVTEVHGQRFESGALLVTKPEKIR